LLHPSTLTSLAAPHCGHAAGANGWANTMSCFAGSPDYRPSRAAAELTA